MTCWPPSDLFRLVASIGVVSVASLKVIAASEEVSVKNDGGVLTISKASCADKPVQTSTFSPTPLPSLGSSAAALRLVMLPLFGASKMGSVVMFTTLLSLLTGNVYAEGHDKTCEPSLEIEVVVPCDCPYNNFVNGVCMTPTQIADMAVQALFVDFDVDAARSLLAENYIQHNPGVPTGAAPVLGFLPALKDSGLEIETHRTIAQGNLVAYHSTYTNATLFGGETLIAFDVFRVEDGKLQEHWDNLQEEAGPNPSGNSMVDGPTMIKYLGQTQANQQVAMGLVTDVLINGNATAATQYISQEEYTQHNPDIADGLEGLGAGLAALAEQGLSFAYDEIALVVAEGNFVMTGSPGEFGAGNPTAYYDLFRIEDGLIVEHWDVIQSIPPVEEFAHENGKF